MEDSMEKNNSAGRILRIINKCRSGQTNRQQIIVWAEVFSLGKDDSHSITSFLKLAFHELEAIRTEAEDKGIPSHLYQDTLSRLEDLMNAKNLSEAWNQKGNRITEGSLRDLAWLTFCLDDDTAVSRDDVDSLLNDISELEQLMSENKLSNAQRNFLKSQIDVLKKGLKAFNVQGEKAVNDAVKQAVISIPLSEDAQEVFRGEGKDSKPFTAYKKMMQKAVRVSDKVFEAARRVNDGFTLAENFNLLGS